MGAVDSKWQFAVDLNMIHVSVDLEQHRALQVISCFFLDTIKGLKPFLLGCELSSLSFFVCFVFNKAKVCTVMCACCLHSFYVMLSSSSAFCFVWR